MSDKRKRPPLSPEKQAAKNAADRARYHARREAGLKSDEARASLPKLFEKRPELTKDEGFIEKLGGYAFKVIDKIGESLTGNPDLGGGTSRRPREPQRSARPGASKAEQFRAFAEANKGLGKNELVRRAKAAGVSVGSDKMNNIWRDVNERQLDPVKVTKISYVSNSKVKLFGDTHKKFIKDRYMHVMQFEVKSDIMADSRTEWVTIPSDVPLTFRDLVDMVEQYWSREEGGERVYENMEIVPGSIDLVQAVDTER